MANQKKSYSLTSTKIQIFTFISLHSLKTAKKYPYVGEKELEVSHYGK